MEGRVIITISREYGSGGREIGRKLAEQLSIPYYDNELISLAAKESGLDSELFEEADQRKTSDFFYSMAAFGSTAGVYNIPLNDQVFVIPVGCHSVGGQEGKLRHCGPVCRLCSQ